ncbi:MAG: phosphate ABC transporter permease subunit PstC, partial [Flavobacterium sp.]
TNWKELGGPDLPIVLFRTSDITEFYTEEELGPNFEYFPDKLNQLIKKQPGIIAFFSDKYKSKNFSGKELDIDKISVYQFLSGEEWFPTAQPIAQMGVKPLIYGTLWVSFGAILLALPIGLAAAIYLSEIAKKRTRSLLKPLIELLAGIPSVVYGFFGLVVIVPLIQSTFNLPVGETALAGSVVLAIMALPTIITISEDAMRNTPRAMKEASLALGASKWQTIYKVVMPYSASGITAGAILGIGRAIGETMAVLMVTGNAAVIPHSFLAPVRTIPATIAAELGEAPNGGLHYEALFALGCILFIITFGINMLVELVTNRKSHKKH